MKRGYRFLFLLMVFALIGCQQEREDKISIDLDQLIGSLGLDSNTLHAPAQEQLGTIIFYRSKRLVDRFSWRLGLHLVDEPTETVIQLQGALADHFLKNSKNGLIKKENDDVVYIVGDLAAAIFSDVRNLFTIDDIDYLEGKEIIVVSGSETKTALDYIKNRFNQYYSHLSQKGKRVYLVSRGLAKAWVRDCFQTFYSDLKILFTTNPLKVLPLTTLHSAAGIPAGLANGAIEGVQKIVLMTDQVCMLSFDSVGRLLVFLSGGGVIQESVVLRKTAQLGGGNRV